MSTRPGRPRRRRRPGPPPDQPPALGRRARKKETTKSRIVAAALTLFQIKGFEATTTKAIARKARVAEGTVFNYFPTKEDIALHFLGQEVDNAMAAVRGNVRLRKAPLEEKLFVLVQTQLEFLAPHERFIGAAFVQALKPGSKLGVFSPSAQALQFRYLAFVQELVDDAIRRDEMRAAGWWTSHVFWIYYLGILLYWLHDTSPGKQQTLAFLDRSLKIGAAVLRQK
jgi:AcrR family transcriptional regulator